MFSESAKHTHILENLEIAIPTYQRSKTLWKHTLSILPEELLSKVVIYLQENDDTRYDYIDEEKGRYAGCSYIVLHDVTNIAQKRNMIKKNTEKKYLLMIDDDIRALVGMDGINLSPERVKQTILAGFEMCEESKARLWGVNPYSNSFYFKNTVTETLKFICGGFHGTIMDKPPVLCYLNTLEDYYNTLEHFKRDGAVLRLNNIGIRTTLFTNKGGLQSVYSAEDRQQQEFDDATKIVDIFGEKMVRKHTKKRGIDLRLNHHYKNPQ